MHEPKMDSLKNGEKPGKVEKKELRKLSRGELLEIILQLKENEEELKEKLAEAERRLSSREISIKKAGSIAEAALLLSDIFGSAQRAVDIYTESVKKNYSQTEERNARAEFTRRELLKNAEAQADKIVGDAKKTAARILEETEISVNKREEAFKKAVQSALSTHAELKKMLGVE